LLRDEEVPLTDGLLSAGGSLVLAGVLLVLVVRLWRREKLLG
jgi:hypothetical protein